MESVSRWEKIKNISVGQDGEVDIPKEIVIGKTRDLFGEKIYETITNLVEDTVAAVGTSDDIDTIGSTNQNVDGCGHAKYHANGACARCR